MSDAFNHVKPNYFRNYWMSWKTVKFLHTFEKLGCKNLKSKQEWWVIWKRNNMASTRMPAKLFIDCLSGWRGLLPGLALGLQMIMLVSFLQRSERSPKVPGHNNIREEMCSTLLSRRFPTMCYYRHTFGGSVNVQYFISTTAHQNLTFLNHPAMFWHAGVFMQFHTTSYTASSMLLYYVSETGIKVFWDQVC